MAKEITQEQIDDYVQGALCYPIRDTEHLVAMVVLHYDILVKEARPMVAFSLMKLAVKQVTGH